MADELFKIAVAIDVQTAFGTVNGTIAALSGSIASADGILLGDRSSGDAESGISIPNFEQIVREAQAVAASFTEGWDAFLRTAVNGFAVTYALQGNGVTSTPSAGQADPLKGPKAILRAAGLVGANGTSPVVNFTPEYATTYATVKLWIGDLSWVLMDCVVESLEIEHTPGENALATANFRVGSVYSFADGVTFPTLNYTTQASLAAPVVEGVAFAWGQTRGFESLTLSIENTIEEFGDSNVATTGIRWSQTRRQIFVESRMYLATADSDFEYQSLIAATAQTADMTFQVGNIAGATDTINAFAMAINNVQAQSVKYDKTGTAMVAIIKGKATGTAAGSEFTITFN